MPDGALTRRHVLRLTLALVGLFISFDEGRERDTRAATRSIRDGNIRITAAGDIRITEG